MKMKAKEKRKKSLYKIKYKKLRLKKSIKDKYKEYKKILFNIIYIFTEVRKPAVYAVSEGYHMASSIGSHGNFYRLTWQLLSSKHQNQHVYDMNDRKKREKWAIFRVYGRI